MAKKQVLGKGIHALIAEYGEEANDAVGRQVVNLPVEFDASARAKTALVAMGICGQQEMVHVNKVLNAAALTYVAATLQAVLTLLFYISRLSNR